MTHDNDIALGGEARDEMAMPKLSRPATAEEREKLVTHAKLRYLAATWNYRLRDITPNYHLTHLRQHYLALETMPLTRDNGAAWGKDHYQAQQSKTEHLFSQCITGQPYTLNNSPGLRLPEVTALRDAIDAVVLHADDICPNRNAHPWNSLRWKLRRITEYHHELTQPETRTPRLPAANYYQFRSGCYRNLCELGIPEIPQQQARDIIFNHFPQPPCREERQK